MKTTFLSIALLLIIECVTTQAFEKMTASAQFVEFSKAFNEETLILNETRPELEWFIQYGDKGRDFLKDTYNDSKKRSYRKAALYIFCKCWPNRCEGRLRNAEESDSHEMRKFAARIRAYLAGIHQPILASFQFKLPASREILMKILEEALKSGEEENVALAVSIASKHNAMAFAMQDWPEMVADIASKAGFRIQTMLIDHLKANVALIVLDSREKISKILGRDVFDMTGDQVAAWANKPETGAIAASETIKRLSDARDSSGILAYLDGLARRGNPALLSSVANLLNSDDHQIAQAALAVFVRHAKDFGADISSPKKCYIWWVTEGCKKIAGEVK